MNWETPQLQKSTLNVAGIELELFEGGEGAPLLWLHGAEGFSSDQEFARILVTRRRLCAPSHPGFGGSGLPDWLDSVDDIAHVHLELLDRLGTTSIDVVGCSIGGWIAAEMATKSPERVRRLILISPVGVKVGSTDRLDIPDIFAMSQDDVAQRMFHDPVKMRPEPNKLTDDELAIMLRNRETLALLSWEPWMHNPKLRHRLHRAAMPTLLLRGESDGLVSLDYLEAYARLLPNSSVAAIAGTGHVPHLEQPQTLTSAVLEFLER